MKQPRPDRFGGHNLQSLQQTCPKVEVTIETWGIAGRQAGYVVLRSPGAMNRHTIQRFIEAYQKAEAQKLI